MIEEWRPVIGYETYYEVSNLGNVKSLVRFIRSRNGRRACKHGRQFNVKPSGIGYVKVHLRDENSRITTGAHRLVAEAFIPNPDNKPFVNHLNGIKHDNRVENLEWCTALENNIHALRTGLRVSARGSVAGGSTLNEKKVLEICRLLDTTELTNEEIATHYGVQGPAVANIHVGKKWSWLTKRKEQVELYKNLQGNKHPMARPVVNCRGEAFSTAVEASERYGLSRGNLSETCKGKRKSCGQYEDGTPIKWNYLKLL